MLAHHSAQRSPLRARQTSVRPHLERLEGRCVPTLFTVSSAADGGPGSLRDAITAANADPTASTITFAPGLNGQTISLSSGALPAITANNLSIQGPGASALTVSGSGSSSVLSVAAGAAGVSISGLTVANGKSFNSGVGISNAGELTLSASVITGNVIFIGISSGGAGIFNSGTMTINASTITGNQDIGNDHSLGGGIQNSGTMTIVASNISNNSSSAKLIASGGGLSNSGTLTIQDSFIASNTVFTNFISASGGGIDNSGTLTVTGSTVSGNSASPGLFGGTASGGGLGLTAGSAALTNCTLTGNSAPSGGIKAGATLIMLNCTVAANSAGGGLVLGTGAAVTLQNTIVAGNAGGDISGAVTSQGNNLVGNPAGSSGLIASDRTGVNPQLGPLQFNGGLTPTMALGPGSPALDAGNNAAVGLPATDQRGFARIVHDVVDIGAFEFQPPGTVVVVTSSANPALAGQSVLLTATLSPTSAGTNNVPGGTVTFISDGASLGTVALDAKGVASLSTATLAVGNHAIVATYSGDPNFTANSGGLTLSIEQGVTPARAAETASAFDPATGIWYLHNSNASGAPDVEPFAYGPPGAQAVAGDWTGSGHTGIGVYETATGRWQLRNELSAGAPDAGDFFYGGPGLLPVVGDWTGTGHDGIGVYQISTGRWLLRNELSAGAPDAGDFVYGGPGLVPVVGDWNGDGMDTIGVYEVATGRWLLRNSNSAGGPDAGDFVYGGLGLRPVVGDWNGDGVSTIGVFSPATAIWYLRNSNSAGGADLTFQYGGPTGGPSDFNLARDVWPGWTPLATRLDLGSGPAAARPTQAMLPLAQPAQPLRQEASAPTGPLLAEDSDTLALDQVFAQSR
jgi:hypothetical protein